MTFWLSGQIRGADLDTHEAVVMGMHGAHYKHDSLTVPSVFNNQPRPTPMWMYVNWDA